MIAFGTDTALIAAAVVMLVLINIWILSRAIRDCRAMRSEADDLLDDLYQDAERPEVPNAAYMDEFQKTNNP